MRYGKHGTEAAFLHCMKRRIYAFEPSPLHVVGKCPDPVWPAESLSEVWSLFGYLLRDFARHQKVFTHAFVLMKNHYHWLCTFEDFEKNGVSTFNWFHEAATFDFQHSIQMHEIYETGSASSPLFEGSPNITVIDNIQAYRNTYKYVYRNPVAAGIVERAEHYPFSTLSYVLGRTRKRLRFSCFDNMHIAINAHSVLEFINSDFAEIGVAT
jgi:putative transposase